jgi:hypothetical protein
LKQDHLEHSQRYLARSLIAQSDLRACEPVRLVETQEHGSQFLAIGDQGHTQ